MQILTVKLIYQWYIKAVMELLNGQKSWHGSGNLDFSIRGIQEWFIASKKTVRDNLKKIQQLDNNVRSCWFEDLTVPFGEGNNTKTAEKPSTRWVKHDWTCFASDM